MTVGRVGLLSRHSLGDGGWPTVSKSPEGAY